MYHFLQNSYTHAHASTHTHIHIDFVNNSNFKKPCRCACQPVKSKLVGLLQLLHLKFQVHWGDWRLYNNTILLYHHASGHISLLPSTSLKCILFCITCTLLDNAPSDMPSVIISYCTIYPTHRSNIFISSPSLHYSTNIYLQGIVNVWNCYVFVTGVFDLYV